MFTKHEYGVKQHEGKKYLFGPGVSDHIPGLGFGQMGMGDYDKRLASYCKMFVEEYGEEELKKRFWEDRQLNHTEICKAECQSSASGTGAQSKTPRKPKSAPRTPEKEPRTSRTTSAKAKPTKAKVAESKAASSVESVLHLDDLMTELPKMKTRELRKLGDGILSELASRAGYHESLNTRTDL
eukprot:Skav230491  [mRNA]  locus=scaffold2389:19577:20125:- [translate_table: standard]